MISKEIPQTKKTRKLCFVSWICDNLYKLVDWQSVSYVHVGSLYWELYTIVTVSDWAWPLVANVERHTPVFSTLLTDWCGPWAVWIAAFEAPHDSSEWWVMNQRYHNGSHVWTATVTHPPTYHAIFLNCITLLVIFKRSLEKLDISFICLILEL